MMFNRAWTWKDIFGARPAPAPTQELVDLFREFREIYAAKPKTTTPDLSAQMALLQRDVDRINAYLNL